MTRSGEKASLGVPLLMTLLAGTATILLWSALRKDQESRVAEIVEAVSYAARSEMARQLIVQFRAFQSVRDYWSRYAALPEDQWHADATIELDHFDGLEAIAWSERNGPRFFSTGQKIALDHTPTDEEWAVIEDSLDSAFAATSDTVAGPDIDGHGHAVLRVFLPVRTGERSAVLIAVIDVSDQIGAILEDQSPGYDIRVSCCDDTELYRVGSFDADVPDQWKHGGLIQPIPQVLWRVDHQPSVALAATFRTWAIDAVLAVGLALSLAIGAIAYHSRRADERAMAARLAERELRKLNEDLERRVEGRTRDLDQALADLNTINLSVAHDIRTPLNTANLTIEAMRDPSLSDRDSKVERLGSSLSQISAILDRLLALSRVSSFAASFTTVDMRAMAERVVDELAINGLGSGITIAPMPPAHADATMVHILLTNLIGNAVKHAGHGPVEIASRDNGEEIVYFVRDHGPGVDPAQAPELFAPKARARAGGGSGLGLGLAIAARAVSRHGGHIWVEPTDGGGATFCFSFAQPPAGNGSGR